MVNLLGHVFSSLDHYFSKNGLGRPNPRPFVVVAQKDDRLILVKLHSINKSKLLPSEYDARMKKLKEGVWHRVVDTHGHEHAAETKVLDSYHIPIRASDYKLTKQSYTLEKSSINSLLKVIYPKPSDKKVYAHTVAREFCSRKK